MFTGKLFLMSATAVLTGSILFAADDAVAPAAPEAAAHHAVKLTKPYSELTGLSDEQTSKIEEIHGEFLDKQKALLAKERADIEAVLNDEQKEQLKTLGPSKKEKTGKKKATTEPTQ